MMPRAHFMPDPLDGGRALFDDFGLVAQPVNPTLDQHLTVDNDQRDVAAVGVAEERLDRVADRLEMGLGEVDPDEIGARAQLDSTEVGPAKIVRRAACHRIDQLMRRPGVGPSGVQFRNEAGRAHLADDIHTVAVGADDRAQTGVGKPVVSA